MKFEIKSGWDASVLFSLETDSLKLCIEAAVKSRANLRGADLGGADLRGANLRGADLGNADLRGANLVSANLRGAHLRGAHLGNANLVSADLRGADLGSADLGGANLVSANLRGADLGSADLGGALNTELALAQTAILPSDGPLFGWKKCRNNVLVGLFIPSKAKRSHAAGRKCRAEYAKVLAVIGSPDNKGISIYSEKVVYEVGKWVHCDKWNDDRWQECAGGIHFFITKIEAEAYS